MQVTGSFPFFCSIVGFLYVSFNVIFLPTSLFFPNSIKGLRFVAGSTH